MTSEATEGDISLCGSNRVADTINRSHLNRLPGPERSYLGKGSAKKKSDRDLPSPEELRLEVGAQVIFTRKGGGYVNGDIGHVVAWRPHEVPIRIQGCDRVMSVGHACCEEREMLWNAVNRCIERVLVDSCEHPRLAWALTLHRSQCQTLERVHLALGPGTGSTFFERGHADVALSRYRSLSSVTTSRPVWVNNIRIHEDLRDDWA